MTNQTAHRAIRRTGVYLTALLLALLGQSVGAQNGTVAPVPVQQFFDNSGLECASCKLYVYDCGGVVNRTVYTDSGLSVAHTQPIALNSAGRPPSNAGIFLTPGICHKFVLKTSADVELWSADNIGPGFGVGNDRLRVSTHSATIATGAFTATYSQYAVDTESAAAADDLDTITAGTGVGAGFILVLTPANVSRVVTVKHATGNIRLVAGDYRMNGTGSSLTLYYDGSNWIEIARAGGGGWTVVTTTATGTQSDFDPGIVGNTIIRANNASALTITGFPAGTAGQQIIVQAVNAVVDFDHTPSASAATAELINIATSGNTPISTGGFAHYVYDGTTTMWRLKSHEQGAWIMPTFTESHFTGDGTDGNWTVDALDIATIAYRLTGRTATVTFWVNTSDSANTPSTLRITNGQWGGFTAARAMVTAGAGLNATAVSTAREATVIHVNASGTEINIAQTDSGTWTATTSDNTTVYGTITFEVN